MPDVLLTRFAARVADDPFFAAYPLALYQRHHALDDAALAAWLGCTLDALVLVRLCRRPRDAADVATIAARFGCGREALGRVVAT